MRLAGTMIRYSNSAMPQLAIAATYQGLPWKFFRWPYQANVMKRFDAASMPAVTARVCQGGMAGVAKYGDPIPDETLDSIRRTRVALKGPLETPVGEGYRSINVALRKAFDLYANVRPAYSIVPGGRYQNLDLVLIPAESINEDGLFLDDDTFESLRGAVTMPILASYDFVDVLAGEPDDAMAGAA